MTAILRPRVLAGTAAVLAAPDALSEFGAAARDRLAALGAAVAPFAADPAGDQPAFDGDADVLVVDAAALLPGGVRMVLDGAWLAIRPVATTAMIGTQAGGRIVILAPRPGDAAAEGSRAGLENLARTLSVEWARYMVRPVAILPGAATSPAEVAELVCFLASPAGEFYSGCAFTLA